ncbi:MAG TPA: DUF1326 domain-containing protein [Myxococcota bacterium]|nr:DUF1326 domain-containing protein [Myxococcota bacterium]
MPDRWTIRGLQYTNCNCDIGCPCQFNSPTTHGHCEAIGAGVIDEGHFNETRLDGLRWAMLVQWPGEIAEGNGRMQVILDERGDAAQREALRKILHGESTKPGATHFFVFRSTMSQVLDPLYAPIELSIDVPARRARVRIPGILDSDGSPIIDPSSGNEHRVRIELPDGFEYTEAEVGKGRTRARGDIELTFEGSHGHFNLLHMNQDGVIR